MRLYSKPQLDIEPFDVEDMITASTTTTTSPDPGMEEEVLAAAPSFDEITQSAQFPRSTVADPSGAFQQQVTGGNPIQEGLNNLYENFLNRF